MHADVKTLGSIHKRYNKDAWVGLIHVHVRFAGSIEAWLIPSAPFDSSESVFWAGF